MRAGKDLVCLVHRFPMTRAVHIQRESAEYLWDGGLKLHLSAQPGPCVDADPWHHHSAYAVGVPPTPPPPQPQPVALALTPGLFPCSRPCQLPFPSTAQQHSPVSSQNSSVSGPLHSVPLPLAPPMALGAAPPPPAASPSQQLGPDAFAIVERAQQMVEILTEENRVLHQELQGYYDNADKLHKVGGFPGDGRGKVLGITRRWIRSGASGT